MSIDCSLCDDLHPRGAPECPGRRVGTVVAGKYRVERILGIGGVGVVYSAIHEVLRRPVALKMIHPQFAYDKELCARFVREAREQAAIGHPGIVDVRDSGVAEDDCCWLEMERLEGRDLYAVIEADGPLSIERTTAIARDILNTVAVVHARGVVHRDLKSPNIFLATTPTSDCVKILDFGFAKVDDDLQLTMPGEQLGTVIYMSPEQYQDSRTVDHRTDLYAIGVIVFEMLTAKWPLEWTSKPELRRKLLTNDVERHPRTKRTDVPEWLDAIVAKAMARDRDQRFATAGEMLAALDRGPPDPPARPSLLERLFKK